MGLDTPWPLQVRETQNDHWQDVREGGEAGEVFDGGALVEGSGHVVVANHCCCLIRPRAWEDLSLSKLVSFYFFSQICLYINPTNYSRISPIKLNLQCAF